MRNRLVIICSAVLMLTGAPALHGGQLPNLLAISQNVTEFSAPVGTSAEREPSLDNGNSAPVTITGFSISGPHAADFAVTPNTCPISPATLGFGGLCAPKVTFTPSATGLSLANLAIADVDGASQTVLLVGEGLAGPRVFPSPFRGSTSAPRPWGAATSGKSACNPRARSRLRFNQSS
jgi:hypothetical protein